MNGWMDNNYLSIFGKKSPGSVKRKLKATRYIDRIGL